MTVDELRALVIECAGESVVREAEAVDPEPAHTVLANLVADWNAGKDFDPGVYDFLLPAVRVHHARGYYELAAKLTVWHFSLAPFFASGRPT